MYNFYSLLILISIWQSVLSGYGYSPSVTTSNTYENNANSYGNSGSSYGSSDGNYGGTPFDAGTGSGFGTFGGGDIGEAGFNPTWFRGSAVARGSGHKSHGSYGGPVSSPAVLPPPVNKYSSPTKGNYGAPVGIPAVPPPVTVPPPVVLVTTPVVVNVPTVGKYAEPAPAPVITNKYEAPLPPPPPVIITTIPPPVIVTTNAYVPPVVNKYEAPPPPPPPVIVTTLPPPVIVTTNAYVPPVVNKYEAPLPSPPVNKYEPPPPVIVTTLPPPVIITTAAYVAPPAVVETKYGTKPISSYGPPPVPVEPPVLAPVEPPPKVVSNSYALPPVPPPVEPANSGRGSLVYGFGSRDRYGRPSALGGYTRNYAGR